MNHTISYQAMKQYNRSLIWCLENIKLKHLILNQLKILRNFLKDIYIFSDKTNKTYHFMLVQILQQKK